MKIELTPAAKKAVANYLKLYEDRALTGYRNSYSERNLSDAAARALRRILESAPDETGYTETLATIARESGA